MASHLTLEEREVIAHMHRLGKMQTQIAERLARSKSTISRELRRNRSRSGYWAVAAQRRAEQRFTKVQQLLNDRPKKRLGYRTPNEILASRLQVAIET